MRIFTVVMLFFALASVARAEEICATKPGVQSVSHATSNGTKEEVNGSIFTGGLPVYNASTGDGAICYAGQQTGNGVAVVDMATNTLVAGIGGIQSPRKLVVGNSDSRLYTTANAVNPATGSNEVPQVAIVDVTKSASGRAKTLLGFVNVRDAVPTANIAISVAVCTAPTNPAQHRMAVGTGSGHVVRYDTSVFPSTHLTNANFGTVVTELRYSADCSKLYAGLFEEVGVVDGTGSLVFGNLLVLDGQTLAVKKALSLGSTEISSSTLVGARMRVTTFDGFLYTVDTSTDTVKVSWQTSVPLAGVAEGNRLLYVVIPTQNLIQIFRVSANGDLSMDGTINYPVGSSPNWVTVLAAQKKGGKP